MFAACKAMCDLCMERTLTWPPQNIQHTIQISPFFFFSISHYCQTPPLFPPFSNFVILNTTPPTYLYFALYPTIVM